jgi:poly(beta-D-mannuronate) lyase
MSRHSLVLAQMAFCAAVVPLTAWAQPVAPADVTRSATQPVTGLRSPWDLSPVQVTEEPYECGSPAKIGPDIAVGGLNNKDRISPEVRAAAYGESSTALNDLARQVTSAAKHFLSTGSRAAAQCVVDLLDTAAANGAMTGYVANSESLSDQNRALRAFSIAFLQVRGSAAATPEQTQRITSWMQQLVREERSIYEHDHCGPNDCAFLSHRGVETAAAAAAVGIAANDESLARWAYGRYRATVKQIDDRGMLHYDLHGEYALKENLESASALVRIAEFGEANGISLYDYDRDRLRVLVHTVALGLVDPDLFRRAAHEEQRTPAKIESWEVSWASQYMNRYPDPVLIGLLHQACPNGASMWDREP